MAILTTNLINGEKPEFGNPEHIAFIKEQQRVFELKKNGFVETKSWLEERPRYELTLNWECVKCNKKNRDGLEGDEEEFEDYAVTCTKCKSRYEVLEDYHLQLLPPEKKF